MAKEKLTLEQRIETEAVGIALDLLQELPRINSLRVLSVLRHRNKALDSLEPAVVWRILVNCPYLKYDIKTGTFSLNPKEDSEGL